MLQYFLSATGHFATLFGNRVATRLRERALPYDADPRNACAMRAHRRIETALKLEEALRKLGPPELWKEYNDALRGWEALGRPGPRAFTTRSVWVEGPVAEIHSREVSYKRGVYERVRRSRKRLQQGFIGELISRKAETFGSPSSPDSDKVRINPDNWRYMRITDWKQSIAVMRGDQPKTFFDVRVVVQDESDEPENLQSSAKSEAACLVWLTSEMKASPHGSPWTKGEWESFAKEHFTGLSGRAFGRAWASAIAETDSKWGHAGRPRNRRT